MPAAVTACIPCRRLKAKCIRPDGRQTCSRCDRLELTCEIIPRKLGRKLGSKNRSSTSRRSLVEGQGISASASVSSTPGPFYDDEDDDHDEVQTSPQNTRRPSRPMVVPGPTQNVSPNNMLNVLARAANEMPAADTSNQIDTFPFDRRRFLELFRQPAKTLDPDPYAGISVLEEGLDQLLSNGEPAETKPGDEIVHARIDQPRRDLSPTYDVLSAGVISQAEVNDLLDVFWSRCNHVARLLDPLMYTLDYIRAMSATLLTVMLQVAAQCLPVSGHSLALVSKLDNHTEFLLAEITKYGYQSLELCQALILFTNWLKGHKQHQTWQFISQAMGMAIELRLDATPGPPWSTDELIRDDCSPNRMKRNQQRTWMLLVEFDRALAFIRARRPMLRASLAQNSALSAIESWWKDPDALDFDVMTCANLNMRELVAMIQRETQRAMMSADAFDFDRHLKHVDGQIQAWRNVWFDRLSDTQRERLSYNARCARFVVLMTPYEHRMSTEGIRGAARDECLVAAMDVCKGALPILAGSHPGFPSYSIVPYTLYLVGYTAFCTLRILDSAPLAGEHPNVDVDLFHLSILAALAHRCCQMKVHPNIGIIAIGLGIRLLHTTRKFASIRQAREARTAPMNESSAITGFTPTETNDLNFQFPTADATSLDPQDLAFSFDFNHFGDLFPFLEDNNPPFPGTSFTYP